MRPSPILRAGGESPIGRNGHFLGGWGNFGGLKQKGIITYTLSANKQKPFAGAANDAIFNTFRRFSAQVLYVAPPMLLFYYMMDWATHRNHYLNSKAGRQEFADAE
ncbi:UcrQ family protein [Xylariomycetidae sp. FL2044]|nr:UcrQ family protein [Xylariomycetidae sp. FL2044]